MTPSPPLAGAALALTGFVLWGLSPLYFKAIAVVPAPEILAHRIVWSVVCVALLLMAVGQWPAVRAILGERRKLVRLSLSAAVIAINWLFFIWAVGHDRVLQASLGYYITPLVSVLLGRVFLAERLDALQWLAVALAAAGVAVRLAGFGAVPWVSLGIAVTFSSYGLLRKLVVVGAIPGLFVETLLLCPLALAYLWYLGAVDARMFAASGPGLDALLIAAGLVTALPLMLYAAAARRLRLASLGLLQYLVPTLQMLLAVLVFGEAFTPAHAVTFAAIWAALALYSASAWRERAAVRPVHEI